MARSLVYVGIRLGHIFFGLILLGIAGYLLSDFNKLSKEVSGLSALSSAGDLFNPGSNSPIDYSGYSSYSSGSGSSGSGDSSSGFSSTSSTDLSTIASNQLALQQAQNQMIENALNAAQSLTKRTHNLLKRGKGSKSSKVSGGTYSSKSYMSYKVPLGMVISSSVFTLLTAGASIALMFLWPSWALLVLKFLIGWDIFLAILWLASAGTTGKYLSQFSGWKAHYKQAHLMKTLFALSFLMMLSFIGLAVFTFLMVRGEMRSAQAKETAQPEAGNATAENPDSYTVAPVVPAAPGAPMMEETKQPPLSVYPNAMDNQQQQQQQQQVPIQYYAQEPSPPNHPPPPKIQELQSQYQAPYEPSVSPQTVGYEHHPYSPTVSPPPPVQPGVYQLPV